MMNRIATWDKVAVDVKNAKSVKDAIELANLNYNVIKKPVFIEGGIQVPNTFATVNEETGKIYGTVGSNYEIVQNEEAFSFVDGIVSEGLKIEKAGETNDFVYLIASMPEQMILDDAFKPYLIFQNSHNGSTTLRASICPLRIVCANQFTYAFKHANNKISLRHSASIHGRMHEAQTVIKNYAEYMKQFNEQAKELAAISFSADTRKLAKEFFAVPYDASEIKKERAQRNVDLFMNAYEAEDNQNFTGTVWGLLNAFTDYTTHFESVRKTEKADENRFSYVTFNNKLVEEFMRFVSDRVLA